MPDNEVNITIRVLYEGAENAKKAKEDIAAVDKTTKTATKGVDEQNKSLSLLTTNLSKEVPALKAITPVMSALGLSSLMSGAAIAGLGVVVMEASQSLELMMAGIAQTGAVTNQYTAGPMQDWAASYTETKKLADGFGITLEETSKAMGILTATTRDDSISQQILQSALEAHRSTGRPLIDIVNDLTKAYDGTNKVYDKTTGQMLMGMDAVKQLTADYNSQRTTVGQLNTEMDDLAARGLEDLKVGFGFLGSIILLPFKQALAGIANVEIGIGNLIRYIQGINWGDVWSRLKESLPSSIAMLFEGLWNAGAALTGGAGYKAPVLDGGGIVSHPTLALLAANSQPEAVVPLSGAGMGGPINLYLPDGTLIASWIMGQLDNNVRLRTAY